MLTKLKNQSKRFTCVVALLIFVITSCYKPTAPDVFPDTTGGKDIFVSATSSASFSAAQLLALANLEGYGTYSAFIKYDVDFYKLTYLTTYNGKQIQASGLLAVPKNTPSPPALLSAQHGTIFSNSDAPSNFPNTFTGFELFASDGFVTVIPDYIGFGASSNVVHPYYDTQYSGSVVVDMLKAAKYFLSTKSKAISNKLFLIGYSEGGYVTMAAQKAIETTTTNNLTLTAAAEGAGGYDLTYFLTALALTKTYPDPSLLALLINSYNVTYSWNRPLSDFFAAPYASAIPQLLNGSSSEIQINSALSTSTATLFNPTFYSNLSNPSGELVLKAQLSANSFPNWYPKSPTRLYHGTADEDVPFQTSQSTYTRFIAAGSTALTLTSIPNGTHETSIQTMFLDALPWMQSLNSQ